jgi:hypothetical protein
LDFRDDFVFLRLDLCLDVFWVELGFFFEVLGFRQRFRAVGTVAAGRNLGKVAAHGGEPPLVHGKVKNI